MQLFRSQITHCVKESADITDLQAAEWIDHVIHSERIHEELRLKVRKYRQFRRFMKVAAVAIAIIFIVSLVVFVGY